MDKQCAVEGCLDKYAAKGYCQRHYKRWFRHGDTSIDKRLGPQPKRTVGLPEYLKEYYTEEVWYALPASDRRFLRNPARLLEGSVDISFTILDYWDLYKKQNGMCAICKKSEFELRNNKVKRLTIDHDHITGKIRGLLCSLCNKLLGLAKDNEETLVEAIKYLNAQEVS